MNTGPIFCINLPSRTDRKKSALDTFHKNGLTGEHTPLFVDGIPHEAGYVGCKLAHLSILKDMYCKGISRFMILEDDVDFLFPPLPFLKQIESQLPHSWDILYLGINPQSQLRKYSENLYEVRSGLTTHAMIFNNYAILDHVFRVSKVIDKIDLVYQKFIQPLGKCFAVSPICATQKDGFSDVTKCQNNYHDIIINSFNKNK